VGKIITVYPRTPEEAVSLAEALHKLTRRMNAPVIPFDRRFCDASNVYYRFGAFNPLETEDARGRRQLAIRNPAGELIPDVREAENAKPDWVSNPFEERPELRRPRPTSSPQTKNFRVFRALVQRGKGGVYQAIDVSGSAPRLCLLKEGRKNGELNCDGRDGAWRVRHEERVLTLLAATGVDVPSIYTSFEVDGNYYLVTEFIEGECLHNLLRKLKRRIPIARVIGYGIQLAGIFSQIHAAGWVWRDCKPLNLIITPRGELRPLDFEGACPVDEPDPMLWGTPGFTPPEWRDLNLQTGKHDDLYALGSMLYLLLTGRVPDSTDPSPIEKLRPRVPANVRELVMRMLSRSPEQRPLAATVARELKKVLSVSANKVSPLRRKRQTATAKGHSASAGKRARSSRRLTSTATAPAVMGG
jgi:serine/threonine protein kinase